MRNLELFTSKHRTGRTSPTVAIRISDVCDFFDNITATFRRREINGQKNNRLRQTGTSHDKDNSKACMLLQKDWFSGNIAMKHLCAEHRFYSFLGFERYNRDFATKMICLIYLKNTSIFFNRFYY